MSLLILFETSHALSLGWNKVEAITVMLKHWIYSSSYTKYKIDGFLLFHYFLIFKVDPPLTALIFFMNGRLYPEFVSGIIPNINPVNSACSFL